MTPRWPLSLVLAHALMVGCGSQADAPRPNPPPVVSAAATNPLPPVIVNKTPT